MENTLRIKCNMSVNKIKSKIPIISKQDTRADQRLGEKRLDNTNEFVYLCKDSIHGRSKREVVTRIHQVKLPIQRTNTNLNLRKCLVKTFVWSVWQWNLQFRCTWKQEVGGIWDVLLLSDVKDIIRGVSSEWKRASQNCRDTTAAEHIKKDSGLNCLEICRTKTDVRVCPATKWISSRNKWSAKTGIDNNGTPTRV